MLKEKIGDGFTWASCPAEVAEQTHTVVTMLPNNEIVKVSQGRELKVTSFGVFCTFLGGKFSRETVYRWFTKGLKHRWTRVVVEGGTPLW